MPKPKNEPYLSKAQYFEKVDYTPHSKAQRGAHESKARFRVPCCGRRWGKTTFAAKEMGAALFIPNSWYWIVANDYSVGEKEFRIIRYDLRRRLGLSNKDVKITYNPKQGDMRIEMPWDTVLEVKSTKYKDSLLGEGLDGVIMSEAATQGMDIWQQYIEPALSDKLGWAIFPSTPRGFNWFHGLWKLGQDPLMFDYDSWRFPSWTNIVKYPGGEKNPELQRIKSVVSPMYWAQEYAADFTSYVGKIYDDFSSDNIIDIDYNPAWKNFWAFDFGYSNPFVCLDIMVDPSDNVYVWREYQKTYLSTYEHAHVLMQRSNPEGFHVDNRFADPRGADEIATLRLFIGAINATPVGWSLGVESVKRHLKKQPNGKPKLFIDRSCTELIRQMEGLKAKDPSRDNKNPVEGQHDYDDHGPDALRYFFSEYFVLGSDAHLSDIYSPSYVGSEAEAFFTYHSGFTLNEDYIGYG